MSVQFVVYVRSALRPDAVAAVFEGFPDLRVVERGSVLALLQGEDEVFDLTGPRPVKSFAVPPVVAESVGSATAIYEVMIEGSNPYDVELGFRCAQGLAAAGEGAVVDEAGGWLWTSTGSRLLTSAAFPDDEDWPNVQLELSWAGRRHDLSDDFAQVWLDVSKETYPAALPVRYDEFEPLSQRFAEGGEAAFVQRWRTADGPLLFAGTDPILLGSLDAPHDPHASIDDLWVASLTLRGSAVDSAASVAAVGTFFVTLADRSSAFYAQGQMEGLARDGLRERPVIPYVRKQWRGLPALSPWLMWCSGRYGEVLEDLPESLCRQTERGRYFQASSHPVTNAALRPLQTWLDPDLCEVAIGGPPSPPNSQQTRRAKRLLL